MSSIPKLAELDLAVAEPTRPLAVCVVTSEILGPIKNGGIGTATSGLIEHLARDGHRVTVLYTHVEYGQPVCLERTWAHWVEQLGRSGVELVPIAHRGDYRAWRKKSWLVKEYLERQKLDVVYFNEHHGSGYYALAAKRAGISPFTEQTYCVITHGSIEWVFNTNDQLIRRPGDIEMIGVERRSVEWADVVIGPSEYLLREYARYGWRLPPRTYRQPYPLPAGGAVLADPQLRPVGEIVFFGRLETRKGLWLFCEALDRLAPRLAGTTVTFMGRIADVAGLPSAALIIARSARWPFRVRLLTQLGQDEALAYLRLPGRLAVMPSLADNSPCVVYECMASRIPFLTTCGSGADELVHPDCWPRVMVEPTVDALADRLAQVLDQGAGLGWPRFDAADNLRTWSDWHRWLAASRGTLAAAVSRAPVSWAEAPTVLLVTIDAQACPLSRLVDNVTAHFDRFGAKVGHIVLSSRRGALLELLAELLEARASACGTSIFVLDADSLDLVKDSLLAADIVLFLDADHELLAGFLVAALSMLGRHGAAAVSCVVAERRPGSAEAEIVELPCGDLPGAGGLGLPIGSAVWAAATARLHDELAALCFASEDGAELVSAAALGQTALHQCVLAGKPFRLLPRVGAIRGGEAGGPRHRHHWYKGATQAARNLGIAPRVHPDAAVWLAVVGSGGRDGAEADRIANLGTLADEHPLRTLPHTGDDLAAVADLAAALGRPDQAVQISLAAGAGTGERIGALLTLAERSARLRPALDLRAALTDGRLRRLRADPPQVGSASSAASLRARLAQLGHSRQGAVTLADPLASPALAQIRVYVDNAALRVRPDAIEIGHETDADGAARLMLLDVPLAGHLEAAATLSPAGPTMGRARMIVLDQSTGAEIGHAEASLGAGDAVDLAVPLHGVYELACVALELHSAGGGPAAWRLARLEVR